MPPRDPNMPEGTDNIIDGTSDLSGASGLGSSTGGLGTTSYDDDDMMDDTSSTGASLSGGGMGGSSGLSSGTDFSTSAIGGSSSMSSGMSSGTSSGSTTDIQSLKSQASDKARDVASQGKDKATEALESVSRLVSETADTVDDRLGPQYGNYVRKAADALDGLNDSLRGKQVDELFDDARNLVRKSPVVAIGAAAAIGFLLVRLVKSGMPQTIDQDDDFYSGGSSPRSGTPPRVNNSYDPVA